MKKILVTGGNGMLAFAFKDLIKQNNELDPIYVDMETLDITNDEQVEKTLREGKFDVLLNCAAYTNVDQAETDPEIATKVNGIAVGNLAKHCKENGTLFITYTTDYVFDGENKEGYKEDDKTNPLNAYGVAKELGEKLLQQNSDKYYIIRTQWLYGPNGKNFVDTIVNAFKDGKNLKIVDDQWGSPTYTYDVAQKTLEMISNEDKYKTGIYHITDSGITTWCRFARHFLQTYNHGTEVSVEGVDSDQFPRPAKRPHYSGLISTKTEPLRSWKTAVDEYVKKYLK